MHKCDDDGFVAGCERLAAGELSKLSLSCAMIGIGVPRWSLPVATFQLLLLLVSTADWTLAFHKSFEG